MKKYIMERGSGKTSKMVEFAGITGGILIVPHNGNKKLAEIRAKELGFENVTVLSVSDIVSNNGLCGISPEMLNSVFVDEAASVLSALLPTCTIKAIALSERD